MIQHDKLIKNIKEILDKAASVGLENLKVVLATEGSHPWLLLADVTTNNEQTGKACSQLQEHMETLGFIGVSVLLESNLSFLAQQAYGEAQTKYLEYSQHVLSLDSLDINKHSFDDYSLLGKHPEEIS